jgi:NAD(P)H-hydrate epimerase
MAARACMRAGAGLLTIGAPGLLADSFQAALREEMFLPLPDTGHGTLSLSALDGILDFLDRRGNVLAIGPGIGTQEETRRLVIELLARCTVPMLIDADAINALTGKAALLKRVKAPVVLTPHPGEFSRISGKGVGEIERDRVDAASSFAKRTGAVIILKGVPTVVAEPEGRTFINSAGNPGMAKAGVGDALTGMASALMAQGLSPLGASLLSVYLHGLAGDISASEKGEHSLLSSDIIEAIPGAYRALTGSETLSHGSETLTRGSETPLKEGPIKW